MSGVSCLEGSWTEPSSRRQWSYRCWLPPATRAVLIILHGFGEHGGRYESMAQALAERGIGVAAPDLWGHGRSGGSRGALGELGTCVQRLQALTRKALLPACHHEQYALFGHSFGGLLAIQWAQTSPAALRCAIIQSPLLEVGFPVPRWKRVAAAVLGRCAPRWTFSMDLDVTALSRDPVTVHAYQADPLVHNAMSARTYQSILRTRDDVTARAGSMAVPILLLCGAHDRIISVQAAERWFDRLRCRKRRVVFPSCYHELHHEPVADDVLRMISEWVT